MRAVRRRVVVVALPALFVLAAGCGKEDLRCYVGGTMRPAIVELAQIFEAETGKHVDIDYADSGALLIKIDKTRRGDLYVCHDPFGVALERKNLARRIWTVAALTPMIAVKKGNPKEIHGLRDLAREGIRLGLTDPEYSTLGHINPVMFSKAKLAEAIAKNVVTRKRMGSAVANDVGMGALDAALVWNAVIHARRDKLDAVPIKPQFRPDPKVDAVTTATFGVIDMSCVKVTIATLACSKRPRDATAFARLVDSPRGRRVFAKHGFSPSPVPPSEDEAEEKEEGLAGEPLTLHCGAGIREPAAEAIDAFKAKTGIDVQANYGGSGILISRIKASEVGDLYMPGDVQYIERAAELGLVRSSHDVCYFVPVILVPKGNPKGIKTLADLARPGVRLGLGNPEACAIGKLSVRLREKTKVDAQAVRANLEFASYTVNELGVQIKGGHLDATIVWDATAAQYADSALAIPIPLEQNIISRVAIAVLNCATQPKKAEQFARFLASERGQAIFRKYHFTTKLPKQ